MRPANLALDTSLADSDDAQRQSGAEDEMNEQHKPDSDQCLFDFRASPRTQVCTSAATHMSNGHAIELERWVPSPAQLASAMATCAICFRRFCTTSCWCAVFATARSRSVDSRWLSLSREASCNATADEAPAERLHSQPAPDAHVHLLSIWLLLRTVRDLNQTRRAFRGTSDRTRFS
jgi:hypothetical protein